ncbi:15449_t:CDS:2 [Acaulospora colombiana]|uniref:15449_t:CDS:1 n=1 Tax=Acaulospora colombiana TaxID=27376 RepID=A0ACA9NDJ9_9GLOM|nr:15449_t:CDS:2 [Acaulospora colombiana]
MTKTCEGSYWTPFGNINPSFTARLTYRRQRGQESKALKLWISRCDNQVGPQDAMFVSENVVPQGPGPLKANITYI